MTITLKTNLNEKSVEDINNKSKRIGDFTIDRIGKKNTTNIYRDKGVIPVGKLGDGKVTQDDLDAQILHMDLCVTLSKSGMMRTNVNFDTVYKQLNEGRIGTKEQKELVYAYQEQILNVALRRSGETIDVNTTFIEKKELLDTLKENNYGDKKRDPDVKDYEIIIKKGVGKITYYDEREIEVLDSEGLPLIKNGKPVLEKKIVPIKTINFSIGSNNKVNFGIVNLHEVNRDGRTGPETWNDVLLETVKTPVIVAKAVEIEGPPTKVTVAVSLSKYYDELKTGEKKGGEINTYDRIKEKRNVIYKTMSEISYSEEKKLREETIKEDLLYSNQDIEKGLSSRKLNTRDKTRREVSREVDEFTKKIKGKNEETKGVFALKTIKGKGRGIDVDFSEVDSDFNTMISNVKKYFPEGIIREKHIEFIEEKRKEVKEGFMELAKKANNVEQFIQMSNESEVYGTYQVMLTNYTKYPLQYNIFKLKEVSENSARESVNETNKKKFEKYSISGTRDVIKIGEMLEDKKAHDLYSNISTKEIQREIDRYNINYTKVQEIASKRKELPLPVRTENGKTREDKKVQPAIVKMMPKKSPSQEELDDLKISVKESLTLSEMYIDWFNEGAKKSGIKKMLTGKNPTELFDKMGIDFWEALKDPTFMGKYEKKLFSKQESKEFREFEKYVKMRSYDLKTGFDMGFDLKKEEDLHVAVQLYGEGFIKDREKIKHDIKDTIWRINKDKVECGAFQIFVNKYHGKEKLVEDNIIGKKTESYMYDKNGQPSFLLTLYSTQRNQDTKEINKLLDQASKNEERKKNAKVNEKSFKRAN